MPKQRYSPAAEGWTLSMYKVPLRTKASLGREELSARAQFTKIGSRSVDFRNKCKIWVKDNVTVVVIVDVASQFCSGAYWSREFFVVRSYRCLGWRWVGSVGFVVS